ncbi:hypothetical protein [Actibacterium ureilyticum]|uniref:hypothetical protein n=1 Tax=Actibacterium ureilyticum TaxID=1590614 RepID=UPI000BAAED5F|nr:hypothetical protein [Actibacterium ureilyticum]
MLNAAILLAALAVGAVLMWPRLSGAPLWRATVTPLASIIGSGFLVLGPILEQAYGVYAPLAMAGLCLVAYGFGGAIRYNIAAIDRMGEAARPAPVRHLERAASWALALAYVISVAYYLNLFGAFGVSLTAVDDQFHARLLTSAVFALLLAVGWTHGFRALERLEEVSVGLKLSIIAGLLVGLGWHMAARVTDGGPVINTPQTTGIAALTLGFGLIVTVQGFETARYLGASYPAPLRITAMRLAQFLSTAIYMTYILLIAYAFERDSFALTETAIIQVMQIVAPVLPGLLVAAALSAQFSAAVADTGGAGGLIRELSHKRISERVAYAVLMGIGVALTWQADVFAIINYASRAFAFYYALQSGIAALTARAEGDTAKTVLFAALGALGLAITLFGTPVE